MKNMGKYPGVFLAIFLLFPIFTFAASCPNLIRNLAFGSRGNDVVQLQQFFISQNLLAAGNNTGYFGRLTQSAVQKWQCQQGIVCSGSPSTTGYGAVGPRTRAALRNCAANAASQPAVPPPGAIAAPLGTVPPSSPAIPASPPAINTVPTQPAAQFATDWGESGASAFYILAGYAGLDYDGNYLKSIRTSARASLRDAKAKGLTHVRVAIGGPYFEKIHSYALMQLWKGDPQKYFEAFDLFMSDANALGIKVIPLLMFGVADISEVNDMKNLCGLDAPPLPYGQYTTYQQYAETAANTLPLIPGSKNNSTMKRLALDVVSRYKANPVIGFWEIQNEMNAYAKERSLFATIGGKAYYTQCRTRSQIKDSVASIAHDVKSIDSSHPIASGFMQEAVGEYPIRDVAGGMNDMGDLFRFYNDSPYFDIAILKPYSQMFDAAYQNADRSLHGDMRRDAFFFTTGEDAPASLSTALGYFKSQADRLGKELWLGEYGVISNPQASGHENDCAVQSEGWNDPKAAAFASDIQSISRTIGISYLSTWAWDLDAFSRQNPPGRYSIVRCFSLTPQTSANVLTVVAGSAAIDSSKGRDAQRVIDIQKLKNALEAYNAANGSYPKAGASDEGPKIDTLQSLLVPRYLSSIPHDPKYAGAGSDYYYVWGDEGNSFGLWGSFENAHDGISAGGCVTGINVKSGWWSTTQRCPF